MCQTIKRQMPTERCEKEFCPELQNDTPPKTEEEKARLWRKCYRQATLQHHPDKNQGHTSTEWYRLQECNKDHPPEHLKPETQRTAHAGDLAQKRLLARLQQSAVHLQRQKYNWYAQLLRLRELYLMDTDKLALPAARRKDMAHFANGTRLHSLRYRTLFEGRKACPAPPDAPTDIKQGARVSIQHSKYQDATGTVFPEDAYLTKRNADTQDEDKKMYMVELDETHDYKKIYIPKQYLTRIQPTCFGAGGDAPDGTWEVRAYGGMFFEKMQKQTGNQGAARRRAPRTVTLAGGRLYTDPAQMHAGGGGIACVPRYNYNVRLDGATLTCHAIELSDKAEFTVEELEAAFLDKYAWRPGVAVPITEGMVDLEPHANTKTLLEPCAACGGRWEERETGVPVNGSDWMALAHHPLTAALGLEEVTEITAKKTGNGEFKLGTKDTATATRIDTSDGATTWVHHSDSNVCRFHVIRPAGGGTEAPPPPRPAMAPSPRAVQPDDIIYEGEILFDTSTTPPQQCTLYTVPDRTSTASQKVKVILKNKTKDTPLNKLVWPRYIYDKIDTPQPGGAYLYRNAYGQKEPCIVERTQPLTVRRLDLNDNDPDVHTACALDQLEHLRRWEMLTNPYQWKQCCPTKKDTDRTAEISRWRKFARGSSESMEPPDKDAKKKKKTNNILALSGGAAAGAVRCFPYARQGRIKVYFFENTQQVGKYEIIGNYREDTKAMKALKAGAAPRTREKGEKCLEGVKATAQSDNTYNITFTGFRGHTYVVSMYDQHKEMVQQWFHTQFQVNQTELQPRNRRPVHLEGPADPAPPQMGRRRGHVQGRGRSNRFIDPFPHKKAPAGTRPRSTRRRGARRPRT